jgi:hypothetical protein
MLKTEKNPGGLPISVFDGLRAGLAANRPQFYKDMTLPFYGYNRPGAKISEGIREHRWLQGMMGGAKAHYDCIKAFPETDFTEDLRKIDIPVLVMHGDDDQIVPIGAAGLMSREDSEESNAQGLPGVSTTGCRRPTRTRSTPICCRFLSPSRLARRNEKTQHDQLPPRSLAIMNYFTAKPATPTIRICGCFMGFRFAI